MEERRDKANDTLFTDVQWTATVLSTLKQFPKRVKSEVVLGSLAMTRGGLQVTVK